MCVGLGEATLGGQGRSLGKDNAKTNSPALQWGRGPPAIKPWNAAVPQLSSMGHYVCPAAQAEECGITLDSSFSHHLVNLLVNSWGSPSKLNSGPKPCSYLWYCHPLQATIFPLGVCGSLQMVSFSLQLVCLWLTPSVYSPIINQNKYFPQHFIVKIFKPTAKKKMFYNESTYPHAQFYHEHWFMFSLSCYLSLLRGSFKMWVKLCCSSPQEPPKASCLPQSKSQTFVMTKKGLNDLRHPIFSISISYCFLPPALQHTHARAHARRAHSYPATLVASFILRYTRLCTGCSLSLEFSSYRFHSLTSFTALFKHHIIIRPSLPILFQIAYANHPLFSRLFISSITFTTMALFILVNSLIYCPSLSIIICYCLQHTEHCIWHFIYVDFIWFVQ